MRITERRLRRIIRQVIKESAGGSHKWYTEWFDATENMQGSLNKGAWDCLNDFGISMRDIKSNDGMVDVLTRFDGEGISEGELTKILRNIENMTSADDHDTSKLNLMFTATIKLLIEKGKLKVNLKTHNKDAFNQMKPGDIALVSARSTSGNDRLQSCLIYKKPDGKEPIDSSNYYEIEQNYHNHEIFDRKKAGDIKRYNEKQNKEYLKRREEEERERERQNRKWERL